MIHTGPDPDLAQKLANAVAEGFVAMNLKRRGGDSKLAKETLQDEVAKSKQALEDVEGRLVDVAAREQIVMIEEKLSLAETNLSDANALLSQAIDERIRNEQLWRQAQGDKGDALPQILANATIEGLRGQRSELEAEYQDKRSLYHPGYPLMVQMKDKLGAISRQIVTETARIKESLRAAYETSKNTEEARRKRVDELRSEQLALQKRRIPYDTLKREVDTHRSQHDALLKRYTEVGVAANVGTNNVSVVDLAERGWKSSPNIKRTLTMALLMGLFIGVIGAFAIEHLDDRIRSPEDMERALGRRRPWA